MEAGFPHAEPGGPIGEAERRLAWAGVATGVLAGARQKGHSRRNGVRRLIPPLPMEMS